MHKRRLGVLLIFTRSHLPPPTLLPDSFQPRKRKQSRAANIQIPTTYTTAMDAQPSAKQKQEPKETSGLSFVQPAYNDDDTLLFLLIYI